MGILKSKSVLRLVLSVLSAILFILSWPEIGDLSFFIFFAFVPLFFLAKSTKGNNWRLFFLYAFISFLLWHIVANYWMLYSTIIGSITAWLINSSLMASVLSLAFYSKSKTRFIPFEIILAFYWLSFEIMHLSWELAWPWMNLGHVFANHTAWIQWYEYTGVYGGTFWIIIVNGLVYRLMTHSLKRQLKLAGIQGISLLLLTILPLLFSYHLLNKGFTNQQHLKTAIIQTNFNTYTQKFDGLSALEQAKSIVKQINQIKDTTELIILPEAAIPVNISEDTSHFPESIHLMLELSKTKHQSILVSYYSYNSVYHYNTAALVINGHISETRHKSKLVPFAETMPFEFISKYLKNIIAKEGGLGFTYSRDSIAKVFTLHNRHQTKTGTLICFESVFSDFTSEMVRNGAQFLIIISNDDWWQNTAGHRQHFAYARLHAISNRRAIARAANTGVSGYIDAYGRVISKTKYREKSILTNTINTSDYLSFYSLYEPLIRWGILLIAMMIFIVGILNIQKI